ncbi:hypothetical protein LM597_04385 [Candidatus Acetothermia bacterium]|nr:hypothetical protein [Candidatus Acetothermia bacterium]
MTFTLCRAIVYNQLVSEAAPELSRSLGRGAIVYGKDATGRAHRAGGWGYLFDDERSGFWIGKLIKED